ncbi:MAG: FHA domain-containing protein [Muribaculaceae bacterium]|nr:FHA domain-containing protein [Muribaculaceae bacterium]MBR6432050.1 FHA domain-containing protein [Muribaculaceae bacterium]
MLKIIVGREPKSLQLKLQCGKTTKLMGNPGSVPNSVSREHVAISVDEDNDRYFLENLKPTNEVLVNGISVMKREVGLGDLINLGGDRYPVRVADVVGSFVKEKVDISHLQWVWNDYDNFLLSQQTKNQRVGLIQRASGLLTTGAILIGGLQAAIGRGKGTGYLWLYGLAAAVGVGMLIWSFTQTKAPEKNRMRKEQFLEQYSCPKCGISFGQQPYKQLVKRGKCYNCGVQFKKIR